MTQNGLAALTRRAKVLRISASALVRRLIDEELAEAATIEAATRADMIGRDIFDIDDSNFMVGHQYLPFSPTWVRR